MYVVSTFCRLVHALNGFVVVADVIIITVLVNILILFLGWSMFS